MECSWTQFKKNTRNLETSAPVVPGPIFIFTCYRQRVTAQFNNGKMWTNLWYLPNTISHYAAEYVFIYQVFQKGIIFYLVSIFSSSSMGAFWSAALGYGSPVTNTWSWNHPSTSSNDLSLYTIELFFKVGTMVKGKDGKNHKVHALLWGKRLALFLAQSPSYRAYL